MSIDRIAVEITRPIKHAEYQYGKVSLRLESSPPPGTDLDSAIATLYLHGAAQIDELIDNEIAGKRENERRQREVAELLQQYRKTRSKRLKATIRKQLAEMGIDNPDDDDWEL